MRWVDLFFFERQDRKMNVLGWLDASWSVKSVAVENLAYFFSLSSVGTGQTVGGFILVSNPKLFFFCEIFSRGCG